MTCPAQARLAAAASGEDPAVIEHARECLMCRAALMEQRELLAAVRRLARPSLGRERRAALAAEVMAQSDFADEHRPWRGDRVMALAASIVAAAAVVTIVIANQGPSVRAPLAPAIAIREEGTLHSALRAQLDPVAAPLRAAVVATGVYARVQHGDQDVVTLRDGEVSVDATDREPVTIVAGDTRVTLVSSRAKVVARQGVIVTAQVFAGTANVTTTGGRQQVIDAGDVWMREPEAKPAVAEATTDSLSAFRTGWEELRAHHHAQAIAAFDRATDPVVAEDATFWAAIACERAGDLDGAATRLRGFLDRFPTSPRADAARAALERVSK